MFELAEALMLRMFLDLTPVNSDVLVSLVCASKIFHVLDTLGPVMWEAAHLVTPEQHHQ